MKYMGSKSYMLKNGLGQKILRLLEKSNNFVDLFSGSGSVSAFAATNSSAKVTSVDLQHYSKYLCASIICRTKAIVDLNPIDNWIEESQKELEAFPFIRNILNMEIKAPSDVVQARKICSDLDLDSPTWNAYGGHYFSPLQSLSIDVLRKNIPQQKEIFDVCLASLIIAATYCTASPGHTAQPLQPKTRNIHQIAQPWSKNVFQYVRANAQRLSRIHAKSVGRALVTDANTFAQELTYGDLVFIDPPYSAVQYSRFYHVLETIAMGNKNPISGRGRYPDQKLRPVSKYSFKSKALNMTIELLKTIHSRRATAILTFPYSNTSNGMSGEEIFKIASDMFETELFQVERRGSTLGGGNNSTRPSRQKLTEAVIIMRPR